MNRTGKCYEPVGLFEQATGICPLYIAWRVTDEVEQHYRVRLQATAVDHLVRRAERVFAHNDTWRRKVRGQRGRDYVVSFMRHWLSAYLCAQAPRLFEQLPSSFQNGEPLPLACGTSSPRSTVR
jgi:hypothetical protein